MNDAPQRVTGQPSWSPELLALYERSADGYRRLAFLLLGSQAEAEEVVHDVFTAVAAKGDGVRQPSAYVRRAVVNRCNGLLRRRSVAERHPVDPPPPAAAEYLVEFRDVLLGLSVDQRTVIVLRYFEDLPDREIAEIIGCRRATVRTLAARGLAALRKELRGDLREELS